MDIALFHVTRSVYVGDEAVPIKDAGDGVTWRTRAKYEPMRIPNLRLSWCALPSLKARGLFIGIGARETWGVGESVFNYTLSIPFLSGLNRRG
jgi:hypothetical protein